MSRKSYVPYAKQSKREKRRIDLEKRGTWGSLKPITRRPEPSRAYNRAVLKRQRYE